jgi:hypothetical protein
MIKAMLARGTLSALLCLGAALAQTPALDHFETRIRPVLIARCYGCHSAASAAPQGGLRLDSPAGLAAGGNSGPVLIAGNPDGSLLLRALRRTDKSLQMPPGPALPKEVVADFARWIKDGAPMPGQAAKRPAAQELWSLKKPVRTPGTIDSLLSERLAEKGLAFSPPADRRTLIRRVSLDLTGLAPTAAEIEAFAADPSPDAYPQLIDRLLASPHYGERWGRHWLDLARYADSVNDSVNAGQRYAWSYTYRDWVIASLNADLPYNQFVLYQLAADRLPQIDKKHLAALGFIRLGREFPNSIAETIDDRIDAATRGLLGLTVSCARCHDHKFDPIPTKDYYSLYSIFSNLREPAQLPLLGAAAPQPVYEQRLQRIRQAQAEYRQRRHAEMVAFFRSQEAEYRKAAAESRAMSNPQLEELVRQRQLNLHVLRRWRQGLADPAAVPLAEFEKIYTEGDSNNTRALRVRYNTMLAQAAYDGAPPRAMAVEDLPIPEPAHVFLRGNPNNPGALTPPRTLTCLGGIDQQPFTNGAGRLEFAQSIIHPDNPLTARVLVNRVWMHHFGAGLVATPSDFGFRGELPSHPELLDTLAVDFVASGWSLKKLHRRILLSTAYQQSAADNPAARAIDPENRLLWRANRRRLDIESLRDNMLLAAGRLDRSVGGLPVSLTAQPAATRRTVYGFVERGKVPGILNAFDFASPDQHAPLRYVTTVPQQALFFLNSPFVLEQAAATAAAVTAPAPAQQVRALYRRILGRDPAPAESAAALAFLAANDETKPTPAPSPWQYGVLRGGRFHAFPVFNGDRWQGGYATPAGLFSKAVLRPTGGEPGDDLAVVRRWVSPVTGAISIEGLLRHNQGAVPYGDGVRARLVSSRQGELAAWVANGFSAETRLTGLKVQAGEILDFAVDPRQDPENDNFTWAPIVKAGDRTWNAKDDFAGPPPSRPAVLARLAHVLFETNEFAFVE